MVGKILLLGLPLTLLLAIAPLAASEVKPVTVDYVIGMIDSGLEPEAIIEHIVDHKLTFRLSEKSLERLRAAGASDDLIGVVRDRSARVRDDWERPRRLGEYGDIWSDNGEGDEDEGYGGGAVSYGGYMYFGPWYGYYPGMYGPYFYDPYFIHYSYYLPYGYHSYYFPRAHPPRQHGRFHGHGFVPRGERITPRGSPPAGRSPGGGRTRPPRGSH
jgi:hypothetical protein